MTNPEFLISYVSGSSAATKYFLVLRTEATISVWIVALFLGSEMLSWILGRRHSSYKYDCQMTVSLIRIGAQRGASV